MPVLPCRVTLGKMANDMCHSREQAEQVKARLAEWLAPPMVGTTALTERHRPQTAGIKRMARPYNHALTVAYLCPTCEN